MTDSAFHFTHVLPVRFKDVDAMGHAHHSLPLVYFEEARAAFWAKVTGHEGLGGVDYVLARFEVDYHRRILWPSELTVSLRVSRIGKSSFELEYELRDQAGDLLTSGKSVQVMFDYAVGKAKPIPEDVRGRMTGGRGPGLSL